MNSCSPRTKPERPVQQRPARTVRYIDYISHTRQIDPADVRRIATEAWIAAVGDDKVQRMKCGRWLNRPVQVGDRSDTVA